MTGSHIGESAVAREPRHGARPRLLALEGAHNVRDLGGYQTIDGGVTRWGVLLRADALHLLTRNDRLSLLGYGIGTVVDLRQDNELRRAPSVFEHDAMVTYRHVPLREDAAGTAELPTPQTLVDYYLHLIDHCQRSVRRVFDALTEPQALPALFGCTAGKDRTGIISALLLSALGVRRDSIIADYALTRVYGAELLNRLRAEGAAYAASVGQPADWFDRMLLCEPEFMGATLATLDQRYGGPLAYLRGIGVSAQQLERLRANLIAYD